MDIHTNLMFNCTTRSQTPVTKIGPWGGNGGTSFDIPDLPLSIQTVTIICSDVINSLAFSYVNQAGQKKIVGPWGGDGALAVTVSDFCFTLRYVSHMVYSHICYTRQNTI
jgi:hypothetical protein